MWPTFVILVAIVSLSFADEHLHQEAPSTTFTFGLRSPTVEQRRAIQLDDIARGLAFADIDTHPVKRAFGNRFPWQLDWSSSDNPRKRRLTPPVGHQGECGCCWAFTMGFLLTHEVALHLNASLTDVSVQQVLDCTRLVKPCEGITYTGSVFQLWADQEYQFVRWLEEGRDPYLYPYKGEWLTCPAGLYHGRERMSVVNELSQNFAYRTVNLHPDSLVYALNTVGALYVAVDAWPVQFQFFTRAYVGNNVTRVLTNHGARPGTYTHAVLLVGYRRNEWFKIQNSWGGQWGDGGFVKLPWDYPFANAHYFSNVRVRFGGSGSKRDGERVETVDVDVDPPSSQGLPIRHMGAAADDSGRAPLAHVALGDGHVRLPLPAGRDQWRFVLDAGAVAVAERTMSTTADRPPPVHRLQEQAGVHFWRFNVSNAVEVQFEQSAASSDQQLSVALDLHWRVESTDPATGVRSSIAFTSERLQPYDLLAAHNVEAMGAVAAANAEQPLAAQRLCVTTWQAGKDWPGWAHVTHVTVTATPVGGAIDSDAELRVRRVAFAYAPQCRAVAGYREDGSLLASLGGASAVPVVAASAAAAAVLLCACVAVAVAATRRRRRRPSESSRSRAPSDAVVDPGAVVFGGSERRVPLRTTHSRRARSAGGASRARSRATTIGKHTVYENY